MALITTGTSIPSELRAGDTVSWDLTLTDYSAATHTAEYVLAYGGDEEKDVVRKLTATASGAVHQFRLKPADTVALLPGLWTWDLVVRVTASGDTRAIDDGILQVRPKPGHRRNKSFNAEMVDLLEAFLRGRLPLGYESTTIRGQSMSYLTADRATELLNEYRSKLMLEKMSERTARGLKSGMTGQVRFTRP